MLADWADHLITIPPGSAPQILSLKCAVPMAVFRRVICGAAGVMGGDIYDSTGADAAWDLVKRPDA